MRYIIDVTVTWPFLSAKGQLAQSDFVHCNTKVKSYAAQMVQPQHHPLHDDGLLAQSDCVHCSTKVKSCAAPMVWPQHHPLHVDYIYQGNRQDSRGSGQPTLPVKEKVSYSRERESDLFFKFCSCTVQYTKFYDLHVMFQVCSIYCKFFLTLEPPTVSFDTLYITFPL